MPYMGTIDSNSIVSVRLLSAGRNKESTTLWAGMGDGEVETILPSATVAPGTSREISLTAEWGGMVRVHVKFERDGEVGELEVRVNGAIRDTAHVWGEIWWAYSVESVLAREERAVGAGGGFYGATDSRQRPRSN